jgi:pimeloyl-ACP methyl ester carboxylesterase
MLTPSKLLFLPGISGDTSFWRPVADLLAHPAAKVHLGWPGFGPTPADPEVAGIDDLVARVLGEIDQPSALIAQSMGGVIAVLAALARPDLVTHLVLTATSGGIDTSGLGVSDWRPGFLRANPNLPAWFITYKPDLAADLGRIAAPALLLWGDADPISPVAVGRRLAQLLPRAALHVIPGGAHDLALVHAARVAPLIAAHLAKSAASGD